MAKIVLTAVVKNAKKWEKSFRTHADLFRSQTAKSPMSFTVNEDNEVAIYTEAEDLATWKKILESEATIDAMKDDGVKRKTVKVFVLDKELEL